MVTRTEQAERKLSRLKTELSDTTQRAFSHMKTANGQPMNDKRGGRSFLKKQTQIEDKAISLTHQITAQEERVEYLKDKDELANNGLNASGGLMKTVANLDRWVKRVEELEFVRDFNKKHKLPVNTPYEPSDGRIWFYNASKLKDAKNTVAMLQKMKSEASLAKVNMSLSAKKLIENGQVKQWQKKPIYYFVKGLRKVALVVNEKGDFEISKKYPPLSDTDNQKIKNMLNI